MIHFKRTQAQNLAEWLNIATKDLVPAAKERIGQEIEAHFAEAVEAHRAKGIPENSAFLASLNELGNAHIAAKRFRSQHFTEAESKKIARMFQQARSIRRLLLNTAFIFVLAVYCHKFQLHFFGPSPTILLLGIPFGCITRFCLARRHGKHNVRLLNSLILLDKAMELAIFSYVCGISLYAFVLFLVVQAISIIRNRQISLKLWRLRKSGVEFARESPVAS